MFVLGLVEVCMCVVVVWVVVVWGGGFGLVMCLWVCLGYVSVCGLVDVGGFEVVL